MFRFTIALLAVMIFGAAQFQTKAQAQSQPQTRGQFTVFAPHDGVNAPIADTALSEDAGAIVQDFKEVCLSVYKAAVDNPYGQVSQQDVDWPTGYKKLTDRHSKRVGDIQLDIKINFNATTSLPVKMTEWDVNKLVTRHKYKSFPAVDCSFAVSLSPGETRTDLSYHLNQQWHSKAANKLSAEAVNYAMEQINHDCDFSLIRWPRESKIFITTHKTEFKFIFPHEADKKTSELPECETRAGAQNIQAGGYTLNSSGDVIGPNGQTIGRVNARGEIIDHHGKVIGRVNK